MGYLFDYLVRETLSQLIPRNPIHILHPLDYVATVAPLLSFNIACM